MKTPQDMYVESIVAKHAPRVVLQTTVDPIFTVVTAWANKYRIRYPIRFARWPKSLSLFLYKHNLPNYDLHLTFRLQARMDASEDFSKFSKPRLLELVF